MTASVKVNGKHALPQLWAPPNEVDFLRQGKEGIVRPIYANAVLMLRREGAMFKLRHDEFSARPFMGDEPLTDADLRTLHEWLQHRGVFVGKDISDQAVMRYADLHRFHQVRDWLDTLEWDGIARISHVLIDHAGAEDNDLNRAMTGKWLIQAVARVYEPGCQADSTLVLEGEQGRGKSSLFRAMFGDLWFTDQLPDLKDKDASIQLQGVWCVEISELASIRGKSMDNVKQFLTRRVDRFRTPYGKIADGHPRQTVFAGTINPDINGYLHDATGARRFWPIRVGDDINVQAFSDNRDQIWAEALAKFKAGEPWHLNNRAIAAQAADAQAERFEHDSWLERIDQFLHGKNHTSMDDIFENCIKLFDLADRDQGRANKIAKCLQHLGFHKHRVVDKHTGKRKWAYRRKVEEQTEPSDLLGHDQNGTISQDEYENACPSYTD